jgi:hypothetical protein
MKEKNSEAVVEILGLKDGEDALSSSSMQN